MAKRVAILILALTVVACGSPRALSGANGGRLSEADYRASMERAARFVEPGAAFPQANGEQMKEEPPTGSELGFTAKEAAGFLGR
jgi:hypothetical protein